jgi:hypothetical protein
MIRARFKANPDDYRSVIWPVKYPYWCSGYGDDYSIVVAFVENLKQLKKQWPEAEDIDFEEVEKVEFTERFAKPDWYKE